MTDGFQRNISGGTDTGKAIRLTLRAQLISNRKEEVKMAVCPS